MAKFQKGQSGNPGGRPKEVAEVRELAREHTEDAINALTEIMKNKDAPPAARVSAANALLDRGFGRAPQSIDLNQTGPDLAEMLRERIERAKARTAKAAKVAKVTAANSEL